jgi:membrane associated rhomboid family serine protease
MHLFFNLLMLAMIGSELEAAWGSIRFLKYTLFCSLSCALTYLLLQASFGSMESHAPLIGASGTIYGLLVAYGLVFGERILLFMMLFPMKAKHFIWVLALVQLLTTFYSPGGALSSLAHLMGMATGFLYLVSRAYWRTLQTQNKLVFFDKKQRFSWKKKNPRHLKLIINRYPEQNTDPIEPDSEHNPKTWH